MPLAIGFVSLLMITSVAVNELVIRALRSANQIEASDRAYFIAEAGVEDALYELSPHFAGYETPDLKTDNVRKIDFGGDVSWNSEWTIRSHMDESTGITDAIAGEISSNQKLIISLFNDKSGDSILASNEISTSDPSITTLSTIPNIEITFKVPQSVLTDNAVAFAGGLMIDNDNDLQEYGVNEDGLNDSANCPGFPNSKDSDCDGKEDEDSPEDPVIYWKLMDDSGRTLSPIKGCFGETDSNFPLGGSELCEKSFDGTDISVTLTGLTEGVNNNGDPESIGTFISDPLSAGRKLQMEFLIVAPLQQATSTGKIEIPYLDYGINVSGINDYAFPLPYFTIKSDGYYRDFKQSITTRVMPKTAVPLFDFTIIQQQ